MDEKVEARLAWLETQFRAAGAKISLLEYLLSELSPDPDDLVRWTKKYLGVLVEDRSVSEAAFQSRVDATTDSMNNLRRWALVVKAQRERNVMPPPPNEGH